MSLSVNKFWLSDNALLQIGLYSTPGVNLVLRQLQHSDFLSSLNNVNERGTSSKLQAYKAKKEKFQSFLNIGILIQITVAISAVAFSILFPPAGLANLSIHTSFIFTAGALTSFLYDRALKCAGSGTSYVLSDKGHQQVWVKGF